jgi:hypothetical protein
VDRHLKNNLKKHFATTERKLTDSHSRQTAIAFFSFGNLEATGVDQTYYLVEFLCWAPAEYLRYLITMAGEKGSLVVGLSIPQSQRKYQFMMPCAHLSSLHWLHMFFSVSLSV